MKAKDAIKAVEEKGIEFARLQFVDILGNPKNIVIPTERLDTAFRDGVNFDGSSVAGYATIEESDFLAIPDPGSFTVIPEVVAPTPTARLTCDIFDHAGERYLGDPKYALERALARAKGMTMNVGPECEFYLFRRDGDCPTLVPNDSAGYFDLSHIDLAEEVRGDISRALTAMGIMVHAAHHEVGHGQHEVDLCFRDAMTMAEWVVTSRYVIKVVAALHGLHASFMPKPIHGAAGSGMHVHTSLADARGRNLFDGSGGDGELSDMARHFIGGVIHHIREMTAVLNPTVNSYKRLVPGFEAPTYISWADMNRSALVRIPPERGKGSRFELRSPDQSGNPYLQFAVVLAAGMRGIEDGLEPPGKVETDLYSLTAAQRKEMGIGNLPDNLSHALVLMEGSELVRETLGDHVFNHFLHLKGREWDDYKTRVTPWELERYLPSV